MTTAFQAAVDRAKARRLEAVKPIKHEAYGETFEFEFFDKLSQPAVLAMSAFRAIQATREGLPDDSDEGMEELVSTMTDFIAAMCTPATNEQILMLQREGVLDLRDVMQIMVKVAERASGHPSMSSPSSSGASPQTGETSTAGAAPEESTPLPFL
jgi:hypothetical protein